MSPAALKRALDPAYIGAPFAQSFQFFDGDVSTPMDLTGRAVVLFLDGQGLPDAHHEITGVIQTIGRVLFSTADTSAWIKGDYSLEVRLDGASVVVGRIPVAKGAAAQGSDMVGAAQPPTAPGIVIAGSGVVQVVSVAPSAATDPSAIILPADLSAALGGAETLYHGLLWLAQNGNSPSPILRNLIGDVIISSVAAGALSVTAAGEVLLSGAISSVSSATGSLTVGAASSIALVGSAVCASSLTGAMTVVTQIALAGAVMGASAVSGALTITDGDAVVSMNASRTSGPGNNGSSTTTSASGAAVPWTLSLVNESGAAIEVADAVFAGRYLTSSGNANVGNDVLTTANITYSSVVTPLTKGGSTSINIVNGAETVTDQVTLPTPIPAGASYTISGNGAPTTGQKYVTTNFGLIMVRSTRLRSTMKKVNLLALGDSIMTNNGGALLTASSGRCPCVSMSISGTRISSYVAAHALQASIVALAGATHVISNFWVNSANAGDSNATILAQLDTVAAAMLPAKWVQTTPTPNANPVTVVPSAASVSGGVLTMTVPDASLFEVGVSYTFSGFTPSTFNGFGKTPLSVNLETNVVTFPAGGVADATGTVMGTIGASAMGSSRKLQAANNKNDQRADFGAAVRAGHFSGGYIEWGDACEVTRNDGTWAVGGEKPKLLAYRDVTITSIIGGGDNRAGVSGYGYPGSTTSGGYGVWLTGANANRPVSMGTNTGPSDISFTSPASQGGVAFSVGDTMRIIPGVQRATDDLLHPRVAISGYGGQQLILDPTAAWLDGLLAV